MEKTKEYSNGEVTVIWKPTLCFHSEKCWRGLPEVFKPKGKPWIQPDNSDTDTITKQVDQCPSGALTYIMKRTMEKSSSKDMDSIKIDALPSGPLMVHSHCRVTKSDGTVEERKDRAAFCRCGASENKPFCDGAHKKIGFTG